MNKVKVKNLLRGQMFSVDAEHKKKFLCVRSTSRRVSYSYKGSTYDVTPENNKLWNAEVYLIG